LVGQKGKYTKGIMMQKEAMTVMLTSWEGV